MVVSQPQDGGQPGKQNKAKCTSANPWITQLESPYGCAERNRGAYSQEPAVIAHQHGPSDYDGAKLQRLARASRVGPGASNKFGKMNRGPGEECQVKRLRHR